MMDNSSKLMSDEKILAQKRRTSTDFDATVTRNVLKKETKTYRERASSVLLEDKNDLLKK